MRTTITTENLRASAFFPVSVSAVSVSATPPPLQINVMPNLDSSEISQTMSCAINHQVFTQRNTRQKKKLHSQNDGKLNKLSRDHKHKWVFSLPFSFASKWPSLHFLKTGNRIQFLSISNPRGTVPTLAGVKVVSASPFLNPFSKPLMLFSYFLLLMGSTTQLPNKAYCVFFYLLSSLSLVSF